MPTVPYSPVPEVAPSTQATPGVDVSTPIEAFGGGVARSIASVGPVLEKAGDEIFQRAVALQNLENETMAKEADARYVMQMGEMQAKYRSLQGENAVKAYPQFIREAQLLRQQHRQALPNDMTRKMFDGPSLQFMSRTVFDGARHSASENRQWAMGASKARIDAVRSNIFQNPEDEDGFAGAVATTRAESRVLSRADGQSPEQTQSEENKAVSKLYADRIMGLARTQPLQAWEQFQEHKDKLHIDDVARVEGRVIAQRNQAGARIISSRYNPIPIEGQPGMPLRERLERAREEAERIAPGDEGFAIAATERTRVDYDHQRSVLRNDAQMRDNVLIGAVNNGARTIEDLQKNPEASGAWDNTPEPRRRQIMTMMAAAQRGDNNFTPESLRRYQELRGMAQEDPTGFLNIDVLAEPNIPIRERNALSAMQLRMQRVPESNPQTRQAVQNVMPLLQSANISMAQNRTRYLQFVGAFGDALQNEQRNTNKYPDRARQQEIAAQLLREYPTGTNWVLPNDVPWYLGGSRSPLFEQPVPSEMRTEFEKEFKSRNDGRAPSEADYELLRRRYVNEQYKQLWQKQKKQ